MKDLEVQPRRNGIEVFEVDAFVGTRWKSQDTFGWVNEIEITGDFDYMAGGWEYCFLKVNGHRVKGRKTKRISHKSLLQFFERMPDA